MDTRQLRLAQIGFDGAGVPDIHHAIQLFDRGTELRQGAHVLFTAVDLFINNDAVKPFLAAEQSLGESEVFLGGKPETANDGFDLQFSHLDALGDFDFLFARQQRHLAHLL